MYTGSCVSSSYQDGISLASCAGSGNLDFLPISQATNFIVTNDITNGGTNLFFVNDPSQYQYVGFCDLADCSDGRFELFSTVGHHFSTSPLDPHQQAVSVFSSDAVFYILSFWPLLAAVFVGGVFFTFFKRASKVST